MSVCCKDTSGELSSIRADPGFMLGGAARAASILFCTDFGNYWQINCKSTSIYQFIIH